MTSCALLLASLAIGTAAPVPKHGIEVGFVLSAPSVIATCTYSDSEPVKDADVIVYRPGEEGWEYQRGRTDINGVFAFVPDAAGEWKVEVDDGHGHRKETLVTLTEEFFRSEGAVPAAGENAGRMEIGFSDLPIWLRAAFGLSIIFGIACLFYLVKVRKIVQGRTGLP